MYLADFVSYVLSKCNGAELEYQSIPHHVLYVPCTFRWGSAGMPGIGVVTAVSLFSAVNLPIAAVVLLTPINNITDMARTLTNVVGANVTAAVVARKTELLDDEIFQTEDEKLEKKGGRA